MEKWCEQADRAREGVDARSETNQQVADLHAAEVWRDDLRVDLGVSAARDRGHRVRPASAFWGYPSRGSPSERGHFPLHQRGSVCLAEFLTAS